MKLTHGFLQHAKDATLIGVAGSAPAHKYKRTGPLTRYRVKAAIRAGHVEDALAAMGPGHTIGAKAMHALLHTHHVSPERFSDAHYHAPTMVAYCVAHGPGADLLDYMQTSDRHQRDAPVHFYNVAMAYVLGMDRAALCGVLAGEPLGARPGLDNSVSEE
jgi:hypothetical protein